MDYAFEEWLKLDFSVKREIWNHYWDPWNPSIGYKTKMELVENLIKNTKFNSLQYGIKSFGWYVYQLYVVVENSKIRVPRHFAELSVNKGLVIGRIDNDHVRVKFSYGGEQDIDLRQRIYIG